MTDPLDFDRDLQAWIDGELPPERAAAMQAAVDASPELAKRAEIARKFDARVRRSLMSDAGDDAAVRAMIAKARAARTGRVLRLPRFALRVAAAFVLVAWTGMWWFCIPPFECSYMQALEQASRAGNPTAAAEGMAKTFRLPDAVGDAVKLPPAVETPIDFHAWHRQLSWHVRGVRLDYARPDATSFRVTAGDSSDVRPSIRRKLQRDGMTWWSAPIAGERTWAFEGEGTNVLYSVTGPDDDRLYAAAKALRAAVR